MSNSFIALIPAYNEEKSISSVIAGVKKYLKQVIVVDDGSIDETSREARNAGVIVLKHKKNLGKGVALKTGFDYILKNFPEMQAVITLDADGQHDPNEILKFISAFRETAADLIIGERIINRREMPFLRRIGNRLISWLISQKIKQKIIDSQSGFRLISRKILDSLNLKSIDYGLETEILLKCRQYRFKIKTIPISVFYSNRKQINFLKDLKIVISILGHIINFVNKKENFMIFLGL